MKHVLDSFVKDWLNVHVERHLMDLMLLAHLFLERSIIKVLNRLVMVKLWQSLLRSTWTVGDISKNLAFTLRHMTWLIVFESPAIPTHVLAVQNFNKSIMMILLLLTFLKGLRQFFLYQFVEVLVWPESHSVRKTCLRDLVYAFKHSSLALISWQW